MADSLKNKSHQKTFHHQTLMLSVLIAFAFIVALSLVLRSTVIDFAKNHERQHLTKLVEAVQLNLDPVRVNSLVGSPEDLSTATYLAIKKTLASIRDIDPSYRFVYLMARKNGQIIFLADAEPSSSPDFSPPGQFYPDASDELQQIFDNGIAFVEGPIIDKWGEWISAHAALRDPVTAEIVAILGVDVDAKEWNASINAYHFFIITIILLTIVGAAIFSFALIRMSKDRDSLAKANKELQEAREELLQSERLAVLGRLNAIVSHEIRNPLGTISNTLFTMAEAIDRDDRESYAKSIKLCERNVDRCNRIISELLDFSKANNLIKEKVFIDKWLDEMLDQSPSLTKVNVEKIFTTERELEIDKDRMQRAIDNICLNAAQAMTSETKAEPALKVQTRLTEGRLEITFTDNGPGISREDMEKIFEPMFSTKTFGVGLGLPIVQNIMTDHGGGIEVDSTVGEETIVTLWLPVP